MLSFPVFVLSFLFVSFRPALLRSRSRSTGDPLADFSSGADAYLPLSFVCFRFSISLLSLCFFLSLLPASASQGLLQCFGSSFRLLRFPPSLPSGFPYFFSGFWYLAFCLFPFILPGFAPTAAFPALPFFPFSFVHFFFGLFCLLSTSFRPFRLASDYSASCSFFSLLPVLP